MRDSIELFQTLLDQTNKNNMLIKACKLYLRCEYIQCALTALAFFTYKIGMPFLNMVAMSSQRDLKQRLPKLFNDLKEKNIDCLADYHVEWKRVKVPKPETNLESYIFLQMVDGAAEGLKLQRGREYGFSDTHLKSRAAMVCVMTDSDLERIPSNNQTCERNVSKFESVAKRSSKCSNKNLKLNHQERINNMQRS